ncbi:MAG: hypothetical protein EBR82_30340 [Caulobacteraceae bacterium]|nr:hypothetical protein [Caulobacteraceae bacterium]
MSTITKSSGQPESILNAAGVVNPFADIMDGAKLDSQAFAKGETAIFTVVDAAAKRLGIDPTLEQWNAYRESWIKASPLDDPQKGWERFALLLASRCGLAKPKAKGKAEKVAKGREDEAKKVEALAAEPRAVLAQKAKALVEAGTVEALKEAQMVHKAIASQVKAETKEAQESFIALRKEVREAVVALQWNANNRKVLEAIKAMLPKA